MKYYHYLYFINEVNEGQSISNVRSQKLVIGGLGIKTEIYLMPKSILFIPYWALEDESKNLF